MPELTEAASISMSFRLLRKSAFRLFPPDVAYWRSRSMPIWAVIRSSIKQYKSFSTK